MDRWQSAFRLAQGGKRNQNALWRRPARVQASPSSAAQPYAPRQSQEPESPGPISTRLSGWGCWLFCLGMLLWGTPTPLAAQDPGDEAGIRQFLERGEFPLAIEAASRLAPGPRDQWLDRIAQDQLRAGATEGAYQTAELIQEEAVRSSALGSLHHQRFGHPTAQGAGGQAGGVTLADFSALINLIQNTVEPDSWQDVGGGLGTIQAYPSGVYVDAQGTLERMSPEGSLRAQRLRARAASDLGNRDEMAESQLRVVSLNRLEKAVESRLARGLPVTPIMHQLAGLYEIEFVAWLPETGDLVIGGPAGPWETSPQGRPVHRPSGKAVLQLDDLVVCLRNARQHQGTFGCSINPRPENLAETQEFLQASKLQGKRWSETLREKLGQQDVEVFGIEADTHAARVLVEADYRMKLIGMGLEPGVPGVASYFDRLAERPEASESSDVVRWWFTLNYDQVLGDADGTTFALTGPGVQVQSENERIEAGGQRIHTGKSNPETAGFARDFTTHFDELSEAYPVFRQLKNVFDLALVSGLIHRHHLASQAGWEMSFFVGRPDTAWQYPLRRDAVPQQVDSVINERVIKRRGENSTIRQRLVGVSGGISFSAGPVLDQPIKIDSAGRLSQRQQAALPPADAPWWWDADSQR